MSEILHGRTKKHTSDMEGELVGLAPNEDIIPGYPSGGHIIMSPWLDDGIIEIPMSPKEGGVAVFQNGNILNNK